jgi:Glyoxalase-like domain
MYTKIQVVFDATEPEKLAQFWELALGYVVEPPPEGFLSWEEFARSAGIPEEEYAAALIDPAGEGPRLYFQVAGPEVAGEERKRLVSEKVERLAQAGASIAWVSDTFGGNSITMRDPEGNEFCVS